MKKKRVGFGIIGAGNIGPTHAAAINALGNAELAAVADTDHKRATTLADQYGATAYGDYREMLENPRVQAVCLCVPSGLRLPIGKVCAKAGKHLLCEKPLEVSGRRIDELIAAAEAAGIKLGCIFQSRMAQGPQWLRQAVVQNRFGKLFLANAYIKWFRSQDYYTGTPWRATWRLDGGGALMNQGIHTIDLLQWLMGPVKTVFGQTQLAAHPGIEAEDLAIANLSFQNGAFGTIEASTAILANQPTRLEIHGTTGSAVLADNQITTWKFQDEQEIDRAILESIGQEPELGSGSADPKAIKAEGHRRQIEDFAAAILNDRQPLIGGLEARKAVEIIEAVYRSARLRRVVKM
ncbi:MAG: Gfo/Idh/MocA family oxidoreductase [Candidatus Buchananbacteria bacterium]